MTKKPDNKFQIVEVAVPASVKVAPVPDEVMASLADHPGFKHLLDKLRIQKAALESTLIYRAQSDIKDVITIQAGIRWLSWVESNLLKAVNKANNKPARDPNDEELEALDSVFSAIEEIR